jgi:hypothetical protein
VWAIEVLWERLGLGPTLRPALAQQKGRVPYERALLAMTANRLCEPESKLGVWDRWLSRVYLPSCRGLKLPQMYEAMDFLHGQAEEVERASSVRFGFCKGGCWLYVFQQFINSPTHFLLREDYFPLTLTLSPIGVEGIK